MSSELVSILAGVDAVIADGSAGRRHHVLRQITVLFVAQAERLTVDQVCAFDAVILRLARGLGVEARAELAASLAGIANAPSMISRELAFDASSDVAGPILQRSTRLSEDDLLHLAEHRERDHLVALAKRAMLSRQLSEAVLKRGNREAIRALAENDGAALSDWMQTSIVKRAVSDPRLRAALERRSDLSPAHRKRLTEVAEVQTERLLEQEFGFDAQGRL